MAKAKKSDINKGIRALLANAEKNNRAPEHSSGDDGNTLQPKAIDQASISQIKPNPYQPRTEFDEEYLEELKQSIETFGVIQPITVRRLSEDHYQIISGERRWRAAKMAGLKKIPVYIRDADDQGMLEMALLENIQRADLNPLEVSLSFQRLIDECKLTHEELSQRLGKKRSSISNYLRLLKLPPAVQKALQAKQISMGHAKLIAGLDHVEEQVGVLHSILAQALSVRATEGMISRRKIATPAKNPSPPSNAPHPEVTRMQDRLGEKLGARVSITRSGTGKGVIKIPFASDDELNAIMDLIGDE